MNQEFVLGKLGDLMGWDEESARVEFAWLRLMSRLKYDGYQDFLAGMRFIESLADWLQQFLPDEREPAYRFVRENLVFISPGEMRHLVELFYPETVQPRLIQRVAESCGIPRYRVWANAAATRLYAALLRKTVFIELSDGARIDVFRRANAGVINNEQVVTAPRINRPKWDDLLKDLRKAAGNLDERFAFVYLVDDFMGSGTTLLREEDGSWTGKLARFWADVAEAGVVGTHFEPDWTLCVHHYISTHRADLTARERDGAARAAKGEGNWFKRVEFSSGTLLQRDFPIRPEDHPDFIGLVEKYYDDVIETKHVKKGGDNARLGFGQCALPLVLEHNTPNNSIALLWAETDGGPGKHAMRPLFRRRQRHT
jgi:hypothetical protein